MRWQSTSLKILATASILSGAVENVAAAFNWNNTKYVYAFGDSYSFVQGTRGYANFSFIGDMEHLAFTPAQLLSNQIIPKNVHPLKALTGYLAHAEYFECSVQLTDLSTPQLEFLTGCGTGLPSRCTKQLWDFAFAGADISGKLLPLHHVWTVPLVDQVSQWSRFAANVIPHPDDQTLATWWIGINDTGDTLSNTTITDFEAFWHQEMDAYFEAVQTATQRGLHTHLFLNVPPGDRAPASNSNPTKAATQKAHILQYNRILTERIGRFKKANPSTTVLTFDAHAWFSKVLGSPQQYGFTNVTGFCTCANPTGYFWYNSGHPTERVHLLLAEAIGEALSKAAH
ncbi:hypothetical protein CVT24_008022 [Panaeolus cyanescens]|uniref:Carbohydrate esterase family 16 protein n=1 Tax=Panaeolus cyanescens TaxID=181874 RepID=A0A409YQX1_9AGAR|nr:hypothetical protein CVT24_008022 [Panaeolus cyanescens]